MISRFSRKAVIAVLTDLKQEIHTEAVKLGVSHRSGKNKVPGFDPDDGWDQVKNSPDHIRDLYWRSEACDTYIREVQGGYVPTKSRTVLDAWFQARYADTVLMATQEMPFMLACQYRERVYVLTRLAQAFGIEVRSCQYRERIYVLTRLAQELGIEVAG